LSKCLFSKISFDFAGKGLAFKLWKITWDSASLYQEERGKSGDYLFCRNLISYQDFPLGIVGENFKDSDDPAKLFWGLFWELGPMKFFKTNKLCLALNPLKSREW